MTNGEKYKDTIIKHIKDINDSYCGFVNNSYCDFVTSKILSCYGLDCNKISCHDCAAIQSLWFNEEYKEPEEKVDWANVAVDTPVLVRDFDEADWCKRYFAKYQDGQIFTYNNGSTSWSTQGTVVWKQGKLADEVK